MIVQIKSIIKILPVVLLSIFTGCNDKTSKENAYNNIPEINNYVKSELAVQHGMELFNQHCASCHNFSENEIGPNLSGVTSAVEKEWLVAFIDNPMAIINDGDERAEALYQKYGLYMPPFPNIKDQDLEDLLGFIHKFSEGEKRNRSTRKDGLLNPIAERIPQSGLTLVIEEFLTVPASSEFAPVARINKLSAIETKEGERLFLADLRGKLYEITDTAVRVYLDLVVEEEKFIDHPGYATGLGSFAFHPDFERNGLLYTTHTEPPKTSKADFPLNDSISVVLQSVLTEWRAEDPSASIFAGEKREVLRVDMVSGAHGFQEITFNPLLKRGEADYGLLYLGIGDGGAALAGYPFLCDNDGKIWGSVIRIDPTGRNSSNGKYGIPRNNPHINEVGKLGEIWCRGFRNPHRISWDQSGSGKMFITNIGQHSVEEINLGKAGADYGWPHREGTFLFDVNANTELVYPLPSDDSGYTYPVIQYDHDEGNAVSGGFVYGGSKVPRLRNKYIFGDIPRGTMFYCELSEIIDGQQAPVYRINLELKGKQTDLAALASNTRADLRLGVDSRGELFIFTKSNGKVYKIVGCKPDAL